MFFYNNVHFVQGPRATPFRLLESKSYWGYEGQITVNPRHDQAQIIVIEEASYWELLHKAAVWRKKLLK